MGLTCSSLGPRLPNISGKSAKQKKWENKVENKTWGGFYSPYPVEVADEFAGLKYADPSKGLNTPVDHIVTSSNQSNGQSNGSVAPVIICSETRVKNTELNEIPVRSNSVDKRVKSVSFQQPFQSAVASHFAPNPMSSVKLSHIGCYSPKTPIEADPTDTVVVQTSLLLASPTESVHEISLFVETFYNPGSLVSIKPENHPDRVKLFLNYYSIQADDYFQLDGVIDKPQTYREFVSKIIDLSTPPTLEFLHFINGLPESVQGKLQSYEKWIEADKPDILTLLETLVENNCQLPSLDVVFTQLPRITSRLYYITSVEPGVITLNIRRIHVGERLGLASSYLTSLRPKDHVKAEILPYTTLQAPAAMNQPIVVITSGFGISAVRHLWESRRKERHSGSISIIYNVKSPSSILYKSELIARNSAGIIADLLYFTGEPVEAVDRMGNDTKVTRLIGQKLSANGCIYVTGPEDFCIEVRQWIQEALNSDNIREKQWYKEDCGSYKIV